MVLVAFLVAVLAAPMVYVVATNGAVVDTISLLAAAAGVSLIIVSLSGLTSIRFVRAGAWVGAAVLLAALLVRVLYAFVFEFSGRGFDGGFFLHVSGTAVAVGWHEYRREIVFVALAALATSALAARIFRSGAAPSRRTIPLLAPLGAVLLWFGAAAAPEVLLARSWLDYTGIGTKDVQLPQADAGMLRVLGGIRSERPRPVTVAQVEATIPDAPLNLVLVYLESFNEMLTDESRYPGLTPRIASLKTRFFSLPQVHSSAYTTVEGIANSQCGTLFQMAHANNSLVTRSGRLPSLPCLGDILRAAGYRQVYAGGAELDFAGKGDFLEEHGYDDLLGWRHWDDLGYEQIGNWGLSDRHLFEEALATIERLRRSKQPFNLTLLTLGTHLPGFVYAGCPRYAEGEGAVFLNAIHCTDHLFGDFVDALEQEGILEDTVLFAQADHGVFENRDMRRLFGDDVRDTRLLTLIAAPERARPLLDGIDRDRQESSVDTVAAILDLLGVRHNVDFVLASSPFGPADDTRYVLTRRADYIDGNRVDNDPSGCDKAQPAAMPTLPLDDCGKSRVMQAVGAVNSLYSGASNGSANRLCDLAAEVGVDPGSGEVRIRWGSDNLVRRFHHRGVRLHDGGARGVYVALLDAADNVDQALFYGVDNDYDLWELKRLFADVEEGSHILIVTNAARDDVDARMRHAWPEAVGDYKVVYGVIESGAVVSKVAFRDTDVVRFFPVSCGEARLVEAD